MESDIEILRLYQPLPPLPCDDGPCGDNMLPFLYCIVIPVTLVSIFLVILILIICCSRQACKCKKYSSLTADTNNIQMESYNTIRRASATLRHMSHNRETPIMGSRAGSMTLDRSYRNTRRGREACHSAPGTLQSRQHRNRHSGLEEQEAPPPPAYSMITGDLFFGQHRNRHSGLEEQEAPPPPAYSMITGDLFFGSEFLPPAEGMQSSVHYDDSPEHNGTGEQPLLYQQHYQ